MRIDRPPANALDLDLLAEGHAACSRLAGAEPGAVVLTGRPGFFSAGMDLKAAPLMSPDEQSSAIEGINRLFQGWYSFPRPLVAAVNGHAIAGGLILALCADFRVCAGEATVKLGLTELRAGIPYPASAIAVVRAELGAVAARRLALGAALLDPDEALALGAVDELRPAAEVLARAVEVATGMAALPRTTYGVVKRQLRGPALDALERVLSSPGGDPSLGAWVGDETRAGAEKLLGGA